MDYYTPNQTSWSTKLVTRLGRKVRSDKAWTQEVIDKENAKEEARLERIRLQHAQKHGLQVRKLQKKGRNNEHNDINELGERVYTGFSQASTLVESQSAKTKDHTDLLHGLSDDFDYEIRRPSDLMALDDGDEVILVSPKHEAMIASLSRQTWRQIGSNLNPCDAARLARTNKTLRRKMGLDAPFEILDLPENRNHKIAFLNDLDRKLPNHLLCFQCVRYHLRLNPGNETLKADIFTNPLFTCPNATNSANPLPRLRLTHGRELPYSFIQLPLRAARFGPSHGIPTSSMSRRWKCKESSWSHATRYITSESHLLARVTSKTNAPPGYLLTETSARNLLFDREEYTPYFSVCAHWRDGELTAICKCMLTHVPSPPESVLQQMRKGSVPSREAARANFIVRGCDFCVHARRCPDCPTEYLVEIHMVEDGKDVERPVKHQLVVTRWSDLGDGRSQFRSPEWVAVKGEGGEGVVYDSFAEAGRRAVSGRFESAVSGMIPGQRMISLNPKKMRKGEEGHGWY